MSCLFRYDYEDCDAESCAVMMNKLEQIVTSPVYVGTKIIHRNKSYVVKLADNFRYEDPVDGSITERQVGHPAPRYVDDILQVDIMKCLFTNTYHTYPNTRWLCICDDFLPFVSIVRFQEKTECMLTLCAVLK